MTGQPAYPERDAQQQALWYAFGRNDSGSPYCDPYAFADHYVGLVRTGSWPSIQTAWQDWTGLRPRPRGAVQPVSGHDLGERYSFYLTASWTADDGWTHTWQSPTLLTLPDVATEHEWNERIRDSFTALLTGLDTDTGVTIHVNGAVV